VYTLSLPSGIPQTKLEPPALTPDMSIGVGVFPDYTDGKILIFHGYFGLFVYDLKAEKMIFAVDLKKAVDTTIIQGSEGAAVQVSADVRVSADGDIIQLYIFHEEGEIKKAYTINARTGDYTYGNYKPLDAYAHVADEAYNGFSYETLGELTYTDGENSWLIFDEWDWND
jgi:hypothetical protein